MLEFDQVTTRGGDSGESGLYNGKRLPKDDPVFEALGTVDELSSQMGLVKAELRRAAAGSGEATEILSTAQKVLVRLGGQLATPERDPIYEKLIPVGEDDILTLEKVEAEFLKDINLDGSFVLPGKTAAGAALDVSRSVCRRAERRVVTCVRENKLTKINDGLAYLNRLSDLLYVLARWVEGTAAR